MYDQFGDRQSAFYDVVNFQQVQEADAKGLKQVIVGKWDAAERLHLNGNIRWNSQDGRFPTSECLEQCSAGTRKAATSPCCWQCIPCPRGTINPVPGAHSCMECPRGKRSNEARTACEDLPLANLEYSTVGGIAVLAFGILGIIATLFIFAVLCRFCNTPIVRACNRKLSLALLGIIQMLLSLVLLNLFKPTDTICKIIYPWRYITYNLSLSLLLCFAFVCFWCYAVVEAPYKEGDVMLGGLFSVRQLQETSENQCGEITKQVAYAEAMIFAIDKINNDSHLLPNITLGYDIRDYCENITKATQITYELLNEQCYMNTTRSNLGKRFITTLIGPSESSIALVIGGFLKMLNVPGISGTTTSPELSSYNFKHLYRTVPSDTFLAKAVADIIEHFNWTYVAAVGVDDSFGRHGVWSVIKEAENRNGSFCVAVTEFIIHSTQNSSIRHIVTKLRRQTNINVIILWISGVIVRNFFKEVKRQNLSGRVWIPSDIAFTLNENGFLLSDLSPLHGSIAFQPRNFQDKGFKEHMKTLLYNEANKQDLPEWWSDIRKLMRNCSGSNDNGTHKDRLKELCVQDVVNDMYNSYVPYVIDAVYSVAHALDISSQETSLTDNDYNMQRLLSKINFVGLTGNILYDQFGDRQSAFYDVLNIQQVQEADAKRFKQVIVGKWDAAERLHLNGSIRWNSQDGRFPKSECLEQCSAGTRKTATSPCCWQCVSCPRGTINSVPGAHSCMECPRGKRSNEARTACEDLPLANLKYSTVGGIAVLAFGILGIIATLFIFTVMCKFCNTPIVRACNRKLSLALLGIILLLLSLVLLNLFTPTDTICKIIYPWRYITYNLSLSLLLCLQIAMSNTVKRFNWTYVAAVGVDDSFGRHGVWLSSDEARICVKHLHGVDDIRADEAIEYNRTIVQSSKCGTGSILLYNVTKSRRAQSSVQTSINHGYPQ
ncbi:hypothetical protein ACROYT_G030803 [Oculina patagonica]